MDFQETLRHLRFEYHAQIAAQCHDDQATRLIDHTKLAQFPTFYNWLLQRFSRSQLSAHGIGQDIEA